MKTVKYLSYLVLGTFVLAFTSCEPKALKPEDVFKTTDDASLAQMLQEENPQGYRIYTINEFKDAFMTEKGDFGNDTTPYRSRTTNGNGIYLFSIDTIPTDTIGIYVRGRVSTDDYGGNFYKSLVIQQAISWTLPGSSVDLAQQNLRVSVDLGSASGMFHVGQEILIRCNGLSIGRYANQPQLCVPSYNNNIYASSANQKVGWAPGRIPAARFRNAVKLIGTPDPSKLVYDEDNLTNLRTKRGINFGKVSATLSDMDKIRKLDGRLVRVTNIYFTGEYFEQDGSTKNCVYAHPDSVKEANVFAPTTLNVGYPQSRVIANKAKSQTICCSNSEYCKFSNFFFPGALADGDNPVGDCMSWKGSVAGILGWYFDNAAYWSTLSGTNGKEWSITPRGIPGIGMADIEMEHVKTGEKWVPKEFDPIEYSEYKQKKQQEEDESSAIPPIYWPD